LTTSNGSSNLNKVKTGSYVKENLLISKTVLQSFVKMNLVLLRVKGVKVATKVEPHGWTLIVYLQELYAPLKQFQFF